jgi:enoyl-CoA hydratase/carnithine racemase
MSQTAEAAVETPPAAHTERLAWLLRPGGAHGAPLTGTQITAYQAWLAETVM